MFPENNTGDLKLIENGEIQLGVWERNETKQTNSYVNEKKKRLIGSYVSVNQQEIFRSKFFHHWQQWQSLYDSIGAHFKCTPEKSKICQGQPQRETSLNGSVLRNHPQKIKNRRVNS